MSDFTEEVVGTLYDNSQPAGLELNLRTPDNPFDAPVSVVVTRDGYNPKVHDLQEFLPYVRRRSGTVAFFDPASWVSYVQRYWVGDESAIFAGDTQIIAVLNHHPSETPGGRNDWRAVLQLRETPEWQAWSQGAGKWVTQEELANFLELHATDVLSPTAAEVLEAVLDVRAHLSATFRKGINLRNGTIQLEYVRSSPTGVLRIRRRARSRSPRSSGSSCGDGRGSSSRSSLRR